MRKMSARSSANAGLHVREDVLNEPVAFSSVVLMRDIDQTQDTTNTRNT